MAKRTKAKVMTHFPRTLSESSYAGLSVNKRRERSRNSARSVLVVQRRKKLRMMPVGSNTIKTRRKCNRMEMEEECNRTGTVEECKSTETAEVAKAR